MGVQLLRTVRQLATDVGATLIAEGVETEAQFALAKSLGYDAGQGYHFGRAVTAKEMGRMLEEQLP
jgi:EAL domain-containing protein (putative c-di-GMP-specific phosphodiesterase class I)